MSPFSSSTPNNLSPSPQQGSATAADSSSQEAVARYASDPAAGAVEPGAPGIQLSPINLGLPVETRGAEVLRLAQEVFPQTGSWVVFYRLLLGADGVCRKLFPTTDELRYFEATDEFVELNEMVAALRSQDTAKGNTAEPERMITIRIPKSLHDVLKLESDEQNLSINKLCISKLLQRLRPQFVPEQKGRRRGRRPGPQGPRRKVVQETAQPVAQAVSQPQAGAPSAYSNVSPRSGYLGR